MKPKIAAPSAAVRTVSETDDVRLIEGLAYPFKGRDTYGTFFSARTNFRWDLFPDVVPGATRAEDEAKFIRPNTFHHGFDPEIGLARIGGWSPVRMDADGIWVQAQIDKRGDYYATRIGPLLDAGALGLSGGSAEHSVRIDNHTGEVLDWPAYELALTPVESNPLAQIATRAADTGDSLRIVAALANRPLDAVIEAPKAIRYSPSAWDASAAAYVLSSLLDILGDEADETEQAGFLRAAIASVQQFIGAEAAEIGTPEDAAEAVDDSTTISETITVSAWQSGVRSADLDRLRAAAITISSILSRSGAASARSGEDLPAFRVTADPERPDLVLSEMATRAARTAADEAVRRLTG
jgi:hypothetical protein